MLDPDAYVLSPLVVTEITDIRPDLLREYRFRKLIDAYGQMQPNGHWAYSLRDAVGIWAGLKLFTEAKLSRASALGVAYRMAPDVIGAIRGTAAWRKFHASVYTDDTDTGGAHGWDASWRSNRLEDLPAGALVVDHLVDVELFAAAVPPELRAAIMGTAE
jgi:hypothetical protein